MATKIKKQNKARKSPSNAKASGRRRTIESRDLNEDEQQQVTNSTREIGEDIISDDVQNSNFTDQEDREDDLTNDPSERGDQMQEDDKKHEAKEQV